MGHALASTVLEFGFCAVLSRTWRIGATFPPRSRPWPEWFRKANAHWQRASSTREQIVGAILAPAIVPWGNAALGMACGISDDRPIQRALDFVGGFAIIVNPAITPPLTAGELRHIYEEAAEEMGPSPVVPWRRLLRCRQTWGFSIAKFLTDPIWYFYLFWLPSYFSAKFNLNLSHLGLPLIIVYNVSAIGSIGGGWVAHALPPHGDLAQLCAAYGNAVVRWYGGSHLHGLGRQVGVDGDCADQYCGGRAPGLVGESLHHVVGYVSAPRGRIGWWVLAEWRIGGQRAFLLFMQATSCN